MDIKKIIVFSFSSLVIMTLAYLCLHADTPVISSTPPKVTSCGNRPAHTGFQKSGDPQLKKLAEYEVLCEGEVTDTLMMFAAMPTSVDEASSLAHTVAAKLKLFAEQSITPLVSFEPSLMQPTIIEDIKNGLYNTALERYFTVLKDEGITDTQMGTWTLFPEANTPTWHNTNPHTFSTNVTNLAATIKRFFPHIHTTVLLNSRTYPSDDTGWNYGETKDLTPYIAEIPPGTIDSFGYQGFPSSAPANASQPYSMLDAKEFIPATLAEKAAKRLQVSAVWLNTGTFRQMYTNDTAATITLSPTQRKKTLEGIIAEAATLKKQFQTSINLFAKDKSSENEHVDWSYWQAGKVATDPNAKVVAEFLLELRQKDIELSLYDSF